MWNNEDVKEIHKLLKCNNSHSDILWCDGKANHCSAKCSGSDLTFSDSDGENDAHLPKSRGKKKCTRYEEKADCIRIDCLLYCPFLKCTHDAVVC